MIVLIPDLCLLTYFAKFKNVLEEETMFITYEREYDMTLTIHDIKMNKMLHLKSIAFFLCPAI